MYQWLVVAVGLCFALAAVIILMRKMSAIRASFDDVEGQRRLLILCLVGGALIIVSLLVGMSVFLGRMIGHRCDALNRETSREMIQALEAYKQQHDGYPQMLDVLVPEYLTAIPHNRCDPFDRNPFELIECSRENSLLIVATADESHYQRYNLQTGEWLESTPNHEMAGRLLACYGLW